MKEKLIRGVCSTMGRRLLVGLVGVLGLLPLLATAQPQAAATQAPKPPAEDFAVQFGKKLQLHSRILNEDRPYWVYLPDTYHSSSYAPRRYPVLYLLDGDAHFQWASSVVRFMSEGWNLSVQIPELILVAIPNTGASRDRDLTPARFAGASTATNSAVAPGGTGEAFRRFLEEELIPHVEGHYRTAPYRILAGHSLGGLFAVDTFLHRPPLFQAYVAMDPYLDWEKNAALRKAQAVLSKPVAVRECVYLAMANHGPPAAGGQDPGNQACRDFAAFLQTNSAPPFRVRLQYFAEEDHSSIPLQSLYHGLLFVFEGYKPSFEVMANPPALQEHFAKVSERLGFEFLPPQSLVNAFGYYLLNYEHQPEKAIASFQLNAANYPDSPNPYYALGEAYAAAGQKELAIQNFQKVLQLRPANPAARKWLEKLKAP